MTELATARTHELPDDPAELWDRLSADPLGTYRQLREQRPVARARFLDGSPVWLLSRHADVLGLLADPRFSNAFPAAFAAKMPEDVAPYIAGSLIVSDDPQHGRLRRLVGRAFSQRRVGQLRDRVQAVAADLLDDIARSGETDLVPAYSYKLPIRVIHEILGVPEEQRKTWSEAAMANLADRLNPARLADSVRGLVDPSLALIELHRTAPERYDDLLTDLIGAHDEQDGRLSTPELVSMTMAVVLSGFSTTSWFISGSIWALLTHPDQLRLLRDEPDQVPDAIDELLRWLSSVEIGTKRYATETVEIADVRVEAGEAVIPLLSSANHDERVFAEPDRLDLRRRFADQHVALGHGPHYCLGGALARLEGEVALTALFRRFPGLRLTVPGEELAPRLLSGVQRLPVALA